MDNGQKSAKGSGRKREPAKRVLAAEIRKSTHTIDVDGMKRVLLPTGELCSRVFFVGALLDKSRTEGGLWKLRLADPTGAFYAFAGKFQPSVVEAIQEIDTPSILAVAGKLRVFEGEKGRLPYIRPEFIAAVDARTRDLWLTDAVNRTLERLSKLETDTPTCKLAKEVYGEEVYGDIEDIKKAVEIAEAALKSEEQNKMTTGEELVNECKEEKIKEKESAEEEDAGVSEADSEDEVDEGDEELGVFEDMEDIDLSEFEDDRWDDLSRILD